MRRWTGGFPVHHGSWWNGLPADSPAASTSPSPTFPTSRRPAAGDPPGLPRQRAGLSVDGGPDGLDALRAVLADADPWLAPDGAFVTLVARKQAATSTSMCSRADEDDVVVAYPRPV